MVLNEMNMNEMKKIAEFFLEHKITAHVELKDSAKTFYNGLILEVHPLFIVILDRVLGEREVSFMEIKKLERFRAYKNEG